DRASEETRYAWSRSNSPQRNAEALEAIKDAPLQYRMSHLVSRLFFRGIYFPQMRRRDWAKMIFQNRKPIYGLVKEGFASYRNAKRNKKIQSVASSAIQAE
ncbi:MAG: hypothetical protein M3033_15510, partial [Acidobacteriota bacterium]|nr:hypothetical protein [Acidobacteriota bacterium]